MAVKSLNSDEAKQELIRLVGLGKSITDAVKLVGKSRATYDYYRRSDSSFLEAVDRNKILVSRGRGDLQEQDVPAFPDFCLKYMRQRLFAHQLQWFDILEGREPRDMHPSMSYVEGKKQRIIVNTPPHHAKSTTLTVNYVVWRIVQNPNVKIVIVSKSQGFAEKFLLQIKERLVDPEYAQLQADFAPPGGWKEGSASWKATQFYVGGRSTEGKDPTVQAIGIRGQINGARADLIILDDAVDNTNVGEFEKQIDWVLGIVTGRLTPRTGRLLVVGTRIAARDMYSELLVPSRYYGNKTPWTHFQQPAVLEYADDANNWVTLWPFADSPSDPDQEPEADGSFAKWDGVTLSELRNGMTPSHWSRIYQQEQVSEDSVFKSELVAGSCQMRTAGLIPNDASIGRLGGMEGLRIIAGLDPASVGYTAVVVYGIDTKSGHRYVIDLVNRAAMLPDQVRDMIKVLTVRYGIQEWRVERNAFQRWLTLDTEVSEFLAARGCLFLEHLTGDNKNDPAYGVMAMSALFEKGLIHIPNSSTQVVKSLIEQLVVWQPDPPKSMKTDLVMALWFCELRATEMMLTLNRQHYYQNSIYTTRGDISSRRIVDRSLSGQVSSSGQMPAKWFGN